MAFEHGSTLSATESLPCLCTEERWVGRWGLKQLWFATAVQDGGLEKISVEDSKPDLGCLRHYMPKSKRLRPHARLR